jgi:hypothetical protein
VLHYSGLPIDARSLTNDILEQEGKKPRAAPARAAHVAAVTAGSSE